MRLWRSCWLLSVCLFGFSCGAASAAEPPLTPAQPPLKSIAKPSKAPGALQQIVALVNKIRSQGRTCGSEGHFPPASPLVWNTELAAAAKAHSQDMMNHRYFGHRGSNGSSPGERISAQGYQWSWVGENIAFGFATPQAVMTGWLNSPEHCANIMRPQFTEIGVARIDVDWAQEFGRPSQEAVR